MFVPRHILVWYYVGGRFPGDALIESVCCMMLRFLHCFPGKVNPLTDLAALYTVLLFKFLPI